VATAGAEKAKTGFLGLSRSDWLSFGASQGWPKFRAAQIADWIFDSQVDGPSAMTNVGKKLQEVLVQNFDWSLPDIVSALDGADGSTKLLLKTGRGQLIESVILRYEDRVSLCVSSQVGCKMACSFCQTGKLGFFRHLSRHEILAQYYIASRIVRAEGRRVSHVVFMGMGEPLDNYEATIGAAKVLIDGDGFGLSKRHVTISTSGLVPEILKLSDDIDCALAVSLHAARDDLRTELMPINRRWPLAMLKESLVAYQKKTGLKITIEYILIREKNCSMREAKELVRFIHGLQAKVNLIPFNAHPGLPFDRPSEHEIREFQLYLSDRSIPAPVRYSKGLDVSGACGQLAAKTLGNLDLSPARRNVVETPI
jgi:23S rRNA (adenine2503-C2)-methyltransferase